MGAASVPCNQTHYTYETRSPKPKPRPRPALVPHYRGKRVKTWFQTQWCHRQDCSGTRHSGSKLPMCYLKKRPNFLIMHTRDTSINRNNYREKYQLEQFKYPSFFAHSISRPTPTPTQSIPNVHKKSQSITGNTGHFSILTCLFNNILITTPY